MASVYNCQSAIYVVTTKEWDILEGKGQCTRPSATTLPCLCVPNLVPDVYMYNSAYLSDSTLLFATCAREWVAEKCSSGQEKVKTILVLYISCHCISFNFNE